MLILNNKIASTLTTVFALSVLSLAVANKSAVAANIVTNGSFESPDIPTPSFKIFPSIPGWSLSPGSKGIGIEVQDNIAGKPFEGNQFVELDSNGVTGIFQDLATVIGQKYKLEFAFAPRQGVADNRLNIFWGDNLVDSLSANGAGAAKTKWQTFAYELVATSTTTRLSFNDLDEVSNNAGAYLDDVKVTAIPEATKVPEPATVLGLLAIGMVGATSLRKQHQKPTY
ncbi:DUF642 domain-containing protein [Calothrix sp. NIES-2098]|uniref:DUF642 domain-containing protein n=1 Tax=Calothrix sp. NIES-2098 TaxID=1954171 RepID=UPI000B5E2DD4|nr:hemolysin-type calcium-binding region protein [Calothrix sp. NIES-2098]